MTVSLIPPTELAKLTARINELEATVQRVRELADNWKEVGNYKHETAKRKSGYLAQEARADAQDILAYASQIDKALGDTK